MNGGGIDLVQSREGQEAAALALGTLGVRIHNVEGKGIRFPGTERHCT